MVSAARIRATIGNFAPARRHRAGLDPWPPRGDRVCASSVLGLVEFRRRVSLPALLEPTHGLTHQLRGSAQIPLRVLRPSAIPAEQEAAGSRSRDVRSRCLDRCWSTIDAPGPEKSRVGSSSLASGERRARRQPGQQRPVRSTGHSSRKSAEQSSSASLASRAAVALGGGPAEHGAEHRQAARGRARRQAVGEGPPLGRSAWPRRSHSARARGRAAKGTCDRRQHFPWAATTARSRARSWPTRSGARPPCGT
jgi:hypothetical protein